jgi:outer membrane protein OmpA-like peptidoglycan-associated protein
MCMEGSGAAVVSGVVVGDSSDRVAASDSFGESTNSDTSGVDLKGPKHTTSMFAPDERSLPEQLSKPFTVLFAFAGPQASGKAALEEYLDVLAGYLKANPSRNVVLKGYTDDTAARENNVKLAQRRCDVVANMLRDKGVAADQIITEALGETRLKAGGRIGGSSFPFLNHPEHV